MRDLIVATTIIALLGLAAAAVAASWVGRRMTAPIAGLVKSAERLGHGDYSRPVDVARNDELGDLQAALERMRQRLRQTTITKDYLNSVLGSMTDAVFVTSPGRRHQGRELRRLPPARLLRGGADGQGHHVRAR